MCYKTVNKHQTVVEYECYHLQEHQSDDTKVSLKTVNLRTTANYRCEVSAEAPSFASVQGSGRLEVVSKSLLVDSIISIIFLFVHRRRNSLYVHCLVPRSVS